MISPVDDDKTVEGQSDGIQVTSDGRERLLAMASAQSRLARQLEFVLEIDRLKSIIRQTLLNDGSRYENSAEHSWHLALMVLVLSEHANTPIDVARTMKMVLVHDIVEIDAGDTFCYDEAANVGKDEREQLAADRLFGLLPEDQAGELRVLWDEFESRETPEARFAAAVDRLQPMIHNYLTGGHSWRRHGISRERVVERNHPIDDGASVLWQLAEQFLSDAYENGLLDRPDG